MIDLFRRRFSVRIEVALVVSLALIAGFGVVGGVWAPPPLESSGIIEQLTMLVKVVQSAPIDQRDHLIEGATNDVFQVAWIGPDQPLAALLRAAPDRRDDRRLVADRLGPTLHQLVLFDSDDAKSQSPELHFDRRQHPHTRFMAVNYGDDSWMVFSSFKHRWWWLSRPVRFSLWLAYAILAILAVQALAARQLSRPIVNLSQAVRQFGVSSDSPPISASGPREVREVIGAFNDMRAQIQKFVNYRITMLAAISHDLRTPLTRMRLRGEFIDDEEQQARLFRDVDEMQAMIDGALAFFRDDAAEEQVTGVDLPGLLKTIANDFADQGIEISYGGPARAVAQGRPFALKRAFTNLIENAVKYATPPEIIVLSAPGRVSVTIRDHGHGIPPDALEQVFTPYFRLEPSRNRNSGGVGLGLTAAQSIIRGHGGDILLRNHPEGGLVAEVVLPA